MSSTMSSFPSLEPDSSPATMDTLLSRLGSPGRHQAVLVLLLATNLLPVMFQVGSFFFCLFSEVSSHVF